MNPLTNEQSSVKQWVILEVTQHNKLLSQVVKEHGISTKKSAYELKHRKTQRTNNIMIS